MFTLYVYLYFVYLDVPIPSWSKPKFLSDADVLNMGTPLTDILHRTSTLDSRHFNNSDASQPVYPQNMNSPTVYML